jgi:hypothetical protein
MRLKIALRVLTAVLLLAALVWASQIGRPAQLPSVRAQSHALGNLAYTRPRATLGVDEAPAGELVAKWSFDAMPSRWTLAPGVNTASQAGGTRVATNSSGDLQIQSPVLRLPAGAFRILIRSTVTSGGLYAGVEDVAANSATCRTAAYFDSHSTAGNRHWLPIDFTTGGGPVRIALGNWVASPERSVWQLREVRVVNRTTAVESAAEDRKYASLASPFVPESATVNFIPLVQWAFGYKVPRDWYTTPGVVTRRVRSADGSSVLTNHDQYGSVFNRLIRLPAGEYLLTLRGKILAGGLSLGVEDRRLEKWISQRFYWRGQSQGNGIMGVRFHLSHTRTVRLAVTNWGVSPVTSSWLIQGISLETLH